MANKYGEAALIAARLEVSERVTAAERWDVAVRRLYPEKPYMQKKGAPKGAFLGLCAAGLVKDVAADETISANRNGTFAVKAVELLRRGTHRTVTELWAEVSAGEDLEHGAADRCSPRALEERPGGLASAVPTISVTQQRRRSSQFGTLANDLKNAPSLRNAVRL